MDTPFRARLLRFARNDGKKEASNDIPIRHCQTPTAEAISLSFRHCEERERRSNRGGGGAIVGLPRLRLVMTFLFVWDCRAFSLRFAQGFGSPQ